MSQAEIDALRYAARDRDFVATAGLNTRVELMQLRNGKWRAYYRDFITPSSPRGQEAESKEVARDSYGYIITGETRQMLIARLQDEYSNWRWEVGIKPALPSKAAPENPDPDKALYFGEKEKGVLSTIGKPETTGVPKYLYHASRKGELHKEGIEPSVAGVIRKDPEGAKVFMSSDPQDAVNSILTEEALKREHGIVFSTKGNIVVYKIKLPEGSVTRNPRSGDYIIRRKVKPEEIVDFKLRGQKFYAT